MGDAGTPHGRFQRAIEHGNVLAAGAAARGLGQLTLADALALTLLFAEKDRARFERAAVRWHGRFALEVGGLTLAESQLVLMSLAALTGPAAEASAVALGGIARQRDLHGVEAAFGRFRASVRDGASEFP